MQLLPMSRFLTSLPMFFFWSLICIISIKKHRAQVQG